MSRRQFLQTSVALAASASLPQSPRSQQPVTQKVFRWAFPAAETGFDPAQISDLYSNYIVTNNILGAVQERQPTWLALVEDRDLDSIHQRQLSAF